MGAAQKNRRSEIKEKEAWCKERKKACGKRSFWHTSSYIPGCINFDRFSPSSRAIDVDEKFDMAAVEEEEKLKKNMEERENKGPEEKILEYHRVLLVPRHVSTRKIR